MYVSFLVRLFFVWWMTIVYNFFEFVSGLAFWRRTITWDWSLSMEEEVDVTTVEEWIEGEQLTNHTQLGVKLEQLANHIQLKAEQVADNQHEVTLSQEQQESSQLMSQQSNLGHEQLETAQLTADSQNPNSQPRVSQNESDTRTSIMESIQNAVSF